MKRASYREAVSWIAMTDENGGADALDLDFVSSMVTVLLIADIFGVEPERVANDVIRYRKKNE